MIEKGTQMSLVPGLSIKKRDHRVYGYRYQIKSEFEHSILESIGSQYV